MDTDNRVAPPIPLFYWFCLQNLRRHMCCRAIDTISNLVFWNRLASKLGPWHNVYIIQQ